MKPGLAPDPWVGLSVLAQGGTRRPHLAEAFPERGLKQCPEPVPGCHLVVWELLIAFSVTKPLISTGSCVHMWVPLVA